MGEEKRKILNEQAKNRMRLFRQRKQSQPFEKRTRKQIVEQRKTWAEAKRKQRNKQTPEKRRALLLKRRSVYELKSLAKGKIPHSVMQLGRVVVFPESPQKFLKEIEKLITSVSPRKKRLLKKAGYDRQSIKSKKKSDTARREMIINIQAKINSLKRFRKTSERKELKYLISSMTKRKIDH